MNEISKAASDVLAERARQVDAEGWTPQHDDTHSTGEMATAAACYAIQATQYVAFPDRELLLITQGLWPWLRRWFKPKSPRADLVRAAALIIAEIERLDRAEARKAEPTA